MPLSDLLAAWIPGLFLLAALAGAAWGAVGVSAGSPGWGSIRGFGGLFLVGGAVASYLPLRGLRAVLELAGVAGRELGELSPVLQPGVDLIWAGLDQGVQLVLLALALNLTHWPRRAALRAAVALGLGSLFCRILIGVSHHGAGALVPGELATQFFGAAAAAFLLGSLFGAGYKLAGWLCATLALALATWAGQSLPVALRPVAGLALLFAADRLLWSWRVGESEGTERLYPLWRAAYEVHRQCAGARRLLKLWKHISWRERVFRALGGWLPSFVALSIGASLLGLVVVLATGAAADAARLLPGVAAAAFTGIGGLGLAWAATGWHAARNPQWAFLAWLEGAQQTTAAEWLRRSVTYLCVLLVGAACGLAALA